eukprot:TRINITY_DN12685_c5_g1_i2.p1 TRINITY_DN12685_c5_g1~~TRINITY_DN12685_c5_g1_i2.p1  ORF type:complete len:312 (+),score=82.84 TRINITY_DN12685_c5_g1_i2:70-1005(+)
MAHVGNFFREAATLAGIVVKMPFYQLGRIAALFYWPEKDVSEDIVLITGGGSGIGKGLAVKFASLGAKVVLWDLNLKAAEAAAKEINAQYANKAIAYQCDVTDRERVYSLADTVRAEVGKPTILVNNAGIVTGKKLLEADDAMMEKVIQVNTISHLWTLKAFLPDMLEHDHGHVVTVASSAGLFGVAGLVDYCASKFGAVGTDEALRFELRKLGKHGIHTTCVCPYFIDTGMFDGAKSKFPWLLDILGAKHVIDKIVYAVRTNQTQVLLPRFLYFARVLQTLVPPETGDEIAEWCGASDSMDDFKGRSKRD